MKINVGTADRTARLIVGPDLILLAATGAISRWGWIGVALMADT